MSKVGPAGGSHWLAAGQEAPENWDPETEILVGPGGPAAMERHRKASTVRALEAESAAPGDEGDDGLSMEPDQVGGSKSDGEPGDLEDAAYARPAGNASRDNWAEYVAALRGVDPSEYADWKRDDLRAEADHLER